MLREEAVSPQLLNLLKRLFALPVLNNHRLVGGTALALQIGHRVSVDIDLFANTKSNYLEIEKILVTEFSHGIKIAHYINSPLGKGLSFYLEGIKTDIIDWKIPFNEMPIVIDTIRMATLEEIVRMKLDIITAPSEFARFEKKDFIDLAFLLDKFTIEQMLEIYKKSHPLVEYPERMLLEAFQYAEIADKKPNPKMLINLSWEEVNAKIQLAIDNNLRSKF